MTRGLPWAGGSLGYGSVTGFEINTAWFGGGSSGSKVGKQVPYEFISSLKVEFILSLFFY